MRNLLGMLLFSLSLACTASAQARVDRETDGLKGRVKSVRVERSKVRKRDGRTFEESKRLQSVATYDEKGNKLEEVGYNSDGAVTWKRVFARDDKGNRTETTYKADGTIDAKWVTTYDASGKMTGSAQYAADGSLRHKSVREFDANGKLITGAIYDANGSLMNKTFFSYDAKGPQARDALYNADGTLVQELVRTDTGYTVVLYDSDGSVRYKSFDQLPSSELDSNGNWIKQTTLRTILQGGKPEETEEVTYRTIIYY
jgi:hypothetical protein